MLQYTNPGQPHKDSDPPNPLTDQPTTKHQDASSKDEGRKNIRSLDSESYGNHQISIDSSTFSWLQAPFCSPFFHQFFSPTHQSVSIHSCHPNGSPPPAGHCRGRARSVHRSGNAAEATGTKPPAAAFGVPGEENIGEGHKKKSEWTGHKKATVVVCPNKLATVFAWRILSKFYQLSPSFESQHPWKFAHGDHVVIIGCSRDNKKQGHSGEETP